MNKLQIFEKIQSEKFQLTKPSLQKLAYITATKAQKSELIHGNIFSQITAVPDRFLMLQGPQMT